MTTRTSARLFVFALAACAWSVFTLFSVAGGRSAASAPVPGVAAVQPTTFPATGPADSVPFWQLTAAQMKARLDVADATTRTSPPSVDLPDEARAAIKAGGSTFLACRSLAERYFAATGAERRTVADQDNAAVARDVVYEIVNAASLGPLMSDHKGKLDLAAVLAIFDGPYEGVFVVQPADGKPLEQYRFVFGSSKSRHSIESVTRDKAFDADKYIRAAKEAKVKAWVEKAFEGKRENVLGHLPKGRYEYLDAASFHVMPYGRDFSTAGTGVAATRPDTALWTGTVDLLLRYERPKQFTEERLLLTLRADGNDITVVSVKRDDELAKEMEEKLQAAQFIIKCVADPKARGEGLAPGGTDQLPAATAGDPAQWADQEVAISLWQQRRFKMDPIPGDPGDAPLYKARCQVRFLDQKEAPGMYTFLVTRTTDTKHPWLLLRAERAGRVSGP